MEYIIFLMIAIYVISAIQKAIKKARRKDPDVIRVKSSPFKGYFEKTARKFHSTKNDPMEAVDSNKVVRNVKKGMIIGIIVFVVIIILFNVIVVIPAGHTGVQTLFGNVRDKELSAGLHFVNPFVSIERMTIRTEEYTMSIAQGEGQRSGADQITALTNEGLPVDLDITVFYHLNEESASDVYKDLGLRYQEKIIRPEIRSAIREVVAQYDAKAIYSEKRGEVAMGIKDLLVETVAPRGIGVEQVLMRNVTLPPKLSGSIQEKLQAEQESQRYDFILEKEKKEAERKRIEAEGQRDAQGIINQSLTPKYLQYLYIKELKDREGTIYVPTGGDGLPLFKSVQ